MKHTLRGILTLLLVLSLFVSFGALTAFAAQAASTTTGTTEGEKLFDSFAPIGAIIVLKETFDYNGGTLAGAAGPFEREVAKGVKYFIPAAPQKEGDPFVGWKGPDGTMYQPFDRVPISEDTTFTAIYESDLNTANPSEAGMKLTLRG